MRSSFTAIAVTAGTCALAAVMVPIRSVHAAGPGLQAEYAVAYQINPAHSGNINFSSGFNTPLTQIWSVTLDSALSYPVIAENKVFVDSANGETYALDLATGATKWSSNTGVTLGPAYDHGSLFLLDPGAVLTSVSAKSGKQLWMTQLPYLSNASSAPTAYRGQVFATAPGNGVDGPFVYGVNEGSGSVNWYALIYNGADSSPAYGENGVYVSYDCQQYKIASANGSVDWYDSEYCSGGGGETPVYYAGRVYIQDHSNGGANYVLDAQSGNFIGEFGAEIGYPPAFWRLPNGESMGFSLVNGSLYGWKVSTVTNVWSFAGDNQLSTPPIVVNGLVAEGSGSGNVYLLDASSGTEEWSGSTGAGVTALGAGQGILIVISGSIVTAYKPG